MIDYTTSRVTTTEALDLVVRCECGTLLLDEWAHSPHEDDCVAIDGCACDRKVCEACCPDCARCIDCGEQSGEHHLWDCMGAWKMPNEKVLNIAEVAVQVLPVLAVVLLAFVTWRNAW